MSKSTNCIKIVLVLSLLLGWAYGASAAVTLSGALDGVSPTWDRIKDDGTDSYNNGVPFAVFEIMTDTIENLVAVTNSNATDIDTFFALYDGPFDPAAPTLNLLVADDDSGGYPHAGFNDADGVLLSPNISYFLVVSSYSATDGARPAFGNFEVDLGGNVKLIQRIQSAYPMKSLSDDNLGGLSCFIATAAYGSPMSDDVKALRGLRDRFLITNPPGRAFVRFYYRYSPPVAEFIGKHDSLRAATRWALSPVIFSIKHPVGGALFMTMMAGMAIWKIRQRFSKRRS